MASSQHDPHDNGGQVIAASVRADGSVRKERRVRAGYTRQDHVPVYVPRHIWVCFCFFLLVEDEE